MAIPVDVMRLAWTGKLTGGDIWNISFWFRPSVAGAHVPSTNADAATALAQLTSGTAFTTARGAIMGCMRSGELLTGYTLYCYPNGGPTATAIAASTVNVGGLGSGNPLPVQIARAVTTLTGQAGRSFRGRFYIPATGLQITAGDLQFTDNGATLLSGVAGWLVDQRTSNSWNACVVSTVRSTSTPITQLRTDSRPDVQRRRANRQAVTSRTVQSV